MLSQRQTEILLEFCNHAGEYYTASFFAEQMGLSLRTVQSDFKAIRAELENETCMELVSKTSRGSTILIHDQDEFSAYVNALYQEMTTVSLNYPTNRVSKILLMLLNAHRAVSFLDLEETFYISRSTLMNDLKKAEEILGEFQLELLRSNNRIMVDGYEINKRRCLSEQNLYLAHVKNDQGMMYIDERQIAKIKNTLTEVLVDYKYYIMDSDFNNLVLFVNIMIWRIGDGFLLLPNELKETVEDGCEYELAKAIFEKLGHRFFLRIPETEVQYLAIYLKAMGNHQEEGAIPAELDAFIMDTLEKIREQYGYDFTGHLNLRITLALHTMSLILRMQYDMQVKNDMLDYIRETFPLGYDIGTFFGYQLKQKYGKKVTEDEIGLLAIHFYSSLMEEQKKKAKARVLVFTSMKNSMMILLKETLMRWFPEEIAQVDFANENLMDEEDLDRYEIFLTTEKGQMYQHNLAMYINPFPEKKDYFNIKLNIDGFKSIDDVVAIFHADRFRAVKQISKEDALHSLCQMSSSFYNLEGLEEEVLKREEIGSTYLTKGIAMAHPATAVSSDTFISVLITGRSILWDQDGKEANLIMLMHIGKSNPQAFNLWKYVAKIFDDRKLVDRLIANPEYDYFIGLITEALRNNISDDDF